MFCDVCEREFKRVNYYTDLNGKLLSPHGTDNDKYTVYFCGPKCSFIWNKKFGRLAKDGKLLKSSRSS